MTKVPFFKWFKNLSISKKLYSVVGIMVVLVSVEVGTLYFAVHTLSSVRAFVGAEGLWSKSQKDAIYQLRKYYRTHNEKDEQSFYNFMKVPLGDHKTFVELWKKNPDLSVARQGFIEGGNHPDDIDGMIKLFGRFAYISYIHKSIHIWAEADSVVGNLIPIAKKLHSEINSPAPSQTKLDDILLEIDSINQKLTILENDFSYTLGEGARWFERIILKVLLAIALTVGFSGLILTYFVVRGISKGLKEIMSASKSIAKGDFNVQAKIFSNDEIGALANSFNDMTAQLSNNIQKRIQADKDLELKTNFIQENERRIVGIMDALIKTTQLNFSEKLIISDRRDELDAIAVGLNTMSEELEFHLQQLKRSEEKLNAAQRLAKTGNWEWNIVDNIIEWSDELYRIFGMSKENFEANYENYLKNIHPDDRELVNEIVQKAFQDHQPFDFFHRIILPNGDEHTLHGRGEVFLNNEGNIIRMNGTAQDVTKRKKAEQKLNEYTIELERKNKEIEQFAYAASHDLQEPLRSISNFSTLLAEKLEEYPDEEITEYMSLISGGARRMSKLIFDLLEYSRIGKGMAIRTIDCDRLVHEILIDCAAIIEESGAEIRIEKLPVIECYDLKSVFQNLILNAIKFKKKDISPVVNISATDTGKEFIFTIKDNGIGIEKEYYDRIFIIFQRLHLRTEYAGTGIGLSLTKKIIEMHGGKIWVESVFGEGSIFYFTIPKN
ncbi:hypothetical protein BH11BAC3_BH11BAC3_02050 [soil metagenome]